MTSKRQQMPSLSLGLALAVLAGVQTGCQTSTVTFVSYKDPYFPERYRVEFSESVYRTGPSGDIHAVGCANDESELGTTMQFLCVHVFWKPRPGKTPANATTTDATLRYVVATDSGVAVYTGTGFAFPKKRHGGQLEIVIESGRLRLQSQSGDMPDLLGNTRLSGLLKARHDPAEASNLIRQAELLAAR